ncbi:MAG: HPr family phosphocarrier protein [Treponema sp.]|jgi:phosphotransferase system HPr (HPr) family protein|nr:HPr family phosphocarrier protein [Treponema sp.]
MKELSFTITNPVWMHPGTAVSFTLKMEQFSSNIIVSRGGERCDGKDFFGLMKLRNMKGEITTITVDGADEDRVIKSVQEFMRDHLEFS